MDKVIGFYKNKTNEVIKIDKCLLLNDKVNSVIKNLKPIGDQIQVKYSNSLFLKTTTNNINAKNVKLIVTFIFFILNCIFCIL